MSKRQESTGFITSRPGTAERGPNFKTDSLACYVCMYRVFVRVPEHLHSGSEQVRRVVTGEGVEYPSRSEHLILYSHAHTLCASLHAVHMSSGDVTRFMTSLTSSQVLGANRTDLQL